MLNLSIIIPAYNAVNTVECTVRSVMASTLPVDVWVVDDGSSDGTSETLDSLAEEFRAENGSLLHIIHQPNCGAYQARLNALKQIKTPYFGFVDADDTVHPLMFQKMIEFAEKEQLDVVQCGYEEGGRYFNADGENKILLGREEVYRDYIYPKLLDIKESSYIWDKIYRNQYNFDEFEETDHVTNFDDMIFNLQFFQSVKRMGFIKEPFYKYSTTDGSAVHSYNEDKIKDFREAWRVRRVFAEKYGISETDPIMYDWTILNARGGVIASSLARNLNNSERIRLLKKLVKLPEVCIALRRRAFSGVSWMLLILAKIIPGSLFCLMMRTLKRGR